MGKSIKVKASEDRLITPCGLILAGALLVKTALGGIVDKLGKTVDATHKNASCVMAYIGLLCQGKTSYEDVREMQEDPEFHCQALHIESIPSAETMRQRLDEIAPEICDTNIVMQQSAALLREAGISPTPVFTGHVPIDVDVSVHDNSKTKKEGVGWTYKKVDGYSPIYAYIGEEGYVCNVKLRSGTSHSQCEGTVEYLADTLRMARGITDGKLLVRMDSGNDSIDNIKLFVKEGADYVIKRNLRQESLVEWEINAMKHGKKTQPRDGKVVYTGSIFRDRVGVKEPLRIVFRVTKRTMLANGQFLITPEIEVDTWWTSLDISEEEVIRLYCDHATSEQFHSEMKTDIGLERFPSGKFKTNAVILQLAALAFNTLRIMGQTALSFGEKITRHDVQRLRIKTVITRFMFIAGRIITHARQTFLTLGRSNIWRDIFGRMYEAFSST